MSLPLRAPRVAFRVLVVLLAVALMGPLGLVGGAQQPVFRSTVELMAVDVQVVDQKGQPIGQLGPDAFEVSINGKKRRVVSAQFVQHRARSAVATGGFAMAGAVPAPGMDAGTPARTVIVAVDAGSFTPGDIQAATEAASQFIRRLGPDDQVGLFVYPRVSWIAPTTQRAALGVRLANLTGQKEPLRGRFNLSPHEIVDITAQATNPNSFLMTGSGGGLGRRGQMRQAASSAGLDPVLKIQARECPGDANLDCAHQIYSEGLGLATQLEREAHDSLSGLDALLRVLAEMPGRKAVVLVTGGLLVSDRLDGRPDPGTAARAMGQAAARANATIYTIQIDSTSSFAGRAARRSRGETDLARDRALLGNWLEAFSRSAGGQRIEVPVGGGEFAFDRVLSETSAYYLLGVEPADADRDGRPRKLSVKVDGRGLTVRSRQWVLVPPRTRRS
jgi:VWFA-related protein